MSKDAAGNSNSVSEERRIPGWAYVSGVLLISLVLIAILGAISVLGEPREIPLSELGAHQGEVVKCIGIVIDVKGDVFSTTLLLYDNGDVAKAEVEGGVEASVNDLVSIKGEVYSYSTIYHPPAGFEESVPYTVALVRLTEGPLVSAQLTDVEADQVKIGMPVEMVTRRLLAEGEEGVISYGYKFRPLLHRPG